MISHRIYHFRGVVPGLPVFPVLVEAMGGGSDSGALWIGLVFSVGTLAFDSFEGGGLGASAVRSPVPGAVPSRGLGVPWVMGVPSGLVASLDEVWVMLLKPSISMESGANIGSGTGRIRIGLRNGRNCEQAGFQIGRPALL